MIAKHLPKVLFIGVTIMALMAFLYAPRSEIVLNGHVTKVGIYMAAGSERRIAERGSASGYVTEGGRIFQTAGTNVNLVKGVSFGFDFRIDGAPTNRPVRIMHVIIHPKMKKPDGTISERQSFDREVTSSNGVITGSLWYTLREDFELLPGEWTLSVLHGSTTLVEKKFNVYAKEK